jgi:hypothetical protein
VPARSAQFNEIRLHYAIVLPLNVLATVFGLVALCWLALWFGAHGGGQAKAILWTVGVAKALPYGLAVLCSIVGMTFLPRRLMPFSSGYLAQSVLQQVLAIAFYLWLIHLARRRLHGDLALGQAMPFSLRRAFSSSVREAVLAFRASRHWTPS